MCIHAVFLLAMRTCSVASCQFDRLTTTDANRVVEGKAGQVWDHQENRILSPSRKLYSASQR
jgi:hypothetical protein